MLNSMAYCPKCGGIHIFEDVEMVGGPEGIIEDNPTCKGFTRFDLEDAHFGVTNAEKLAMALYRTYHNEDEDGWTYMAREANDDVVKQFRVFALMLCSMAEHDAHEHGMGTVFYGRR